MFKDLEFQVNVCEENISEDTDVAACPKQKAIEDELDEYMENFEEVERVLSEMSNCFSELEEYISENQGEIFYKQYQALEELEGVFFKNADKCISKMNKLKQKIKETIETYEEKEKEIESQLGVRT